MTSPESLIEALQHSTVYPHATMSFKLIETHISWVILTGQYAYKIKKPVDFGFLDYSSLEKRKSFCEKELALNQALASSIYQAVVPIHQTAAGLRIGDDGDSPVIEYALQMKEFSQAALLDQCFERGEVTPDLLTTIAQQAAQFHLEATPASAASAYGSPENIIAPVEENFCTSTPLSYPR